LSSARDTAGLFADPLIGGLAAGQSLTFANENNAVAGLIEAEISGFITTVQPALRGLRLGGYRPVAVDIADPDNTGDIAARIEFNEMLEVSEETPDVQWLLDQFLTYEFAVIIYAVPHTSPAGTSYAMNIPLSGAGWHIGPGRVSDGPASIALGLVCETTTTGLAHDLKHGPVAAIQSDLAAYFAGEWASVPQPDQNVALRPPAKGLLWLLEPRHWYAGGHFTNSHAQAALTVGRDAQIAADAPVPDLTTYFANQMSGVWRTRETMKTVTGKPLRAFFRAGSVARSFQRWSDSGTAPFDPVPDAFKPTVRQLPWFDVICYLVEAKILLPVGLEQGELYDDEFDNLDFEPLIARRPPGTDRVLELCLKDIPGTTPDDPYGVVARISALELLEQDADILYSDPPQSPPIKAFETMFSWEYVPADTPPAEGDEDLAPPTVAQNTTPKLIIVAGPGVSVAKSHAAPVEFQILRKTDFGLPVWGERIEVQQLYRPAFIADTTTGSSSATHTSHGIMIVEKENGIEYSYYPYLTVNSDDHSPVSLPDQPHAKVEIILSDRANAGVSFRSDIDFVQVNSYGELTTRPVLRVWRTGSEVVIKSSESTGVSIELQIYDQPDIGKLFDLYPHMLPVTERYQGDIQGISFDDLPEGKVAYRGNVAEKLPYATEAELRPAGLTPVDLLDSSANIHFEHSFGWYDFFLMGADLIIGLHPYSIALDAAEFFYAYNTGRDRYGRPITTFDLYLMAAGIALPVSGHMLTQIRKGGPMLKALWVPPADALAGDAASLLTAARRQAEGLADAADTTVRNGIQTMVTRYGDDFVDVLTEAEAAALGAARALANMMDGGKTAFKSFELNYHYRRWICSKALGAGLSMNPRGLT
jgi:hypothetical protein